MPIIIKRATKKRNVGGRPRIDKGAPTKSVSVSLLPEHIDYLKKVGLGKVSTGIRVLIWRALRKKNPVKTKPKRTPKRRIKRVRRRK